jgi:ankyrin repeat protein
MNEGSVIINGDVKSHATSTGGDNDDMTLLMQACCDGDTNDVIELIMKQTDVNKCDTHGITALMYASVGHFNCLKVLLENDADVDFADINGWTALMSAIDFGSFDCIKLLIDFDANINKCDRHGITALMYSSCIPSRSTSTKLLLEFGADINAQDNSGMTALMWACQYKSGENIRLLLEYGADYDLQDNTKRTAMEYISNHSSHLKNIFEEHFNSNMFILK